MAGRRCCHAGVPESTVPRRCPRACRGGGRAVRFAVAEDAISLEAYRVDVFGDEDPQFSWGDVLPINKVD